MPSVLQDWVMELPLRHQGTLLAIVRNCDSQPKRPYNEPVRQLTAYLRWSFMVPADQREVDIPGAFMASIPPNGFKPSDLGHLPQHYYAHLIHALEVVAYHHPVDYVASVCRRIYFDMVHNLHLNVETKSGMEYRLTEDRLESGTVVS